MPFAPLPAAPAKIEVLLHSGAGRVERSEVGSLHVREEAVELLVQWVVRIPLVGPRPERQAHGLPRYLQEFDPQLAGPAIGSNPAGPLTPAQAEERQVRTYDRGRRPVEESRGHPHVEMRAAGARALHCERARQSVPYTLEGLVELDLLHGAVAIDVDDNKGPVEPRMERRDPAPPLEMVLDVRQVERPG